MNQSPLSASGWLNKNIADVKCIYIPAWLFIVVSAICYILFCRYFSIFAASWLDTGRIIPEALLFASGFLSGRYAFALLASRFNYKAGNIIVSKVRRKLYSALLKNNEVDSVSGTLLVTRVSDDLKPYYTLFIPYAIASVLVGGILLTVCFRIEKWVGIILSVSFMVIPFLMSIIGTGAGSIHKKHIDLFIKYSAVFHNRLQAIAEIVSLDNFKTQYRFLSEKSGELNKATVKVMRVAILTTASLELFVTLSIAMIAIYLGLSLLGIMPGANYGKGYDFRTALFLLTLAPYFFFYLRKFVSAYHDRNRALAAAELLMPLLNEENAPDSLDTGMPLRSFAIRNLNYSYPGSPVKVLNNIRLDLPVKGLVLVNGISGSGKSTLLKICSGSLSVEEGIISVNGMNNDHSRRWLEANSSYMNQFPFIFDGTLWYNVFLQADGKYDFAPGFLKKLIEKKAAGWQTELSHNGNQLSGGEKQLVTLARMIMHPRAVAILDEPMASLDADTAGVIITQIKRMAEKRLVIVASHEVMFEAIADTVINLNWGEQEI